MMEQLHDSFHILATRTGASDSDMRLLGSQFAAVPAEYLKLVREVTEIELKHKDGAYLRIWGPAGCLEMDKAYSIQRRIPGAIPIGDNGGGRVILYRPAVAGTTLHLADYGDLDRDDLVMLAPSLTELLTKATGAERL
jgi:hypothetical protein